MIQHIKATFINGEVWTVTPFADGNIWMEATGTTHGPTFYFIEDGVKYLSTRASELVSLIITRE